MRSREQLIPHNDTVRRDGSGKVVEDRNAYLGPVAVRFQNKDHSRQTPSLNHLLFL